MSNGAVAEAPSARRPAVSIVLLGDLAMDGRVLKTVRTLQLSGYQATVFCLARERCTIPLPDLAGAQVVWVQAPRPLNAVLCMLRRLKGNLRRQTNGAPAEPAAGQDGPGRLLRDLRALLGTLWLNLVLARAAAGQPAAIVHANDLDTLLAGVLLRRLLGATLVYDAHELYPEMLAGVSSLYVGLWRLIEHQLIRRARAVITVNGSLATELQRRQKLPRRPTVVMNCPPLEAVASQVSLTNNEQIVPLLYHGRFQGERGLTELIAALPQMDRRAVLCLRGSGPLRATLEAAAVAHGVQDRVRFLEPVPPDRLVAELAGFAIGLVPYLPTNLNNYLCTPNKMFDYLMGGLAVVASDLPELRQVILGAQAGLLYRAGDVHDLAGAINTLLTDPGRIERCRVAARSAAVSRYNWEAQAQHLTAVYTEVRGF